MEIIKLLLMSFIALIVGSVACIWAEEIYRFNLPHLMPNTTYILRLSDGASTNGFKLVSPKVTVVNPTSTNPTYVISSSDTDSVKMNESFFLYDPSLSITTTNRAVTNANSVTSTNSPEKAITNIPPAMSIRAWLEQLGRETNKNSPSRFRKYVPLENGTNRVMAPQITITNKNGIKLIIDNDSQNWRKF